LKKLIFAVAACLIALGTVLAAGLPAARALSTGQVCNIQANPDTCANDWNEGPSWKTYTENVANNEVSVEKVDRCNDGYSSTNCPVSGNPSGLLLYQIEYVGPGAESGLCMATASNGYADFGTCNNSSGSGGANGTIFEAFNDGCASGSNVAANVYWNNANGGWFRAAMNWSADVDGTGVDLDSSYPMCVQYIAIS
jgi:hypothetical protein